MNYKNEQSRRESREPIAITGVGLKFPGGVDSLSSFWQILMDGTDCMVDVPADRWNTQLFLDPSGKRPGKLKTVQAGFVSQDPRLFDPLFFNISPREAAVMDPQQRWLLECAWEAFEDAGLVAEEIAGRKAGVFMGGFTMDNLLLNMAPENREKIGSHSAISSTLVMLSNRISYAFDLRGPSLTVDTACSSSLVSTHLACQSIWSGESEWALAGGVNVMLLPDFPIVMSVGQYLSPDSRSQTFGAGANGYARGEGAAVMVLKPLSRALSDGDRIHGLIRATGCNQDGASNGITVPNGASQVDLMEDVYLTSKVDKSQVRYIEAHGTGTPIGDPIEFKALKTVFDNAGGTERRYVGSVKSNLGHLEAAAGAAGLLKAMLVLKHQKVPASLHSKILNPQIAEEAGDSMKVPQETVAFDKDDTCQFAAVNSFGYGGTNAHIVLERYVAGSETKAKAITAVKKASHDEREIFLIPFSAQSEEALKELCRKYISFLEHHPQINWSDLVYTLSCRRSHLRSRIVVQTSGRSELIEQLSAFVQGDKVPGAIVTAQVSQGPIAFIYSGMGPQWWGMGRELWQQNETFRGEFEACDKIFKPLAGWSLVEELLAEESNSKISSTEVAQPMNFALQISLTAVWKELGVEPEAVAGHSVGEIASAYVSGALSLEDAVSVAYHRSRLQKKMAGDEGAMYAVGLPEGEVGPWLESGKVSIAAVNSPRSVTLSGDSKVLEEIAKDCEEKGVFCKKLFVEVAYHSYQMDPLQPELRTALEGLSPKAADISLYSTVSGEKITGIEMDADYWWRNVRETVRFQKAVEALLDQGYRKFIEIGPHPVLKSALAELLNARGGAGFAGATLIRQAPEWKTLLDHFAQIHGAGISVNWSAISPKGKFISLPSYPWQRQDLWFESKRSIYKRTGWSTAALARENRLSSTPTREVELNEQLLPWLKDHQLEGRVVFPGAGYLDAILSLSQQETDTAVATLQQVEFKKMLLWNDSQLQRLQTQWDFQTGKFSIRSYLWDDEPSWELHATGRLLKDPIIKEGLGRLDLPFIQNRCSCHIPVATLYDFLSRRGLDYGPGFQANKDVFYNESEVLSRIEIKSNSGYCVHPSLLDAGFQALYAPMYSDENADQLFVPTQIEQIDLAGEVPVLCWCHGVFRLLNHEELIADLSYSDGEGNVFLRLKGARFQSISRNRKSTTEISNSLYENRWRAVPLAHKETRHSDSLYIIGEIEEWTLALTSFILDAEIPLKWITPGSEYENGEVISFDFNNPENWERFLQEENFKGNSKVIFIASSNSDDEINLIECSKNLYALINLAKAWSEIHQNAALNLSVVTRMGQGVLTGDRPALDQSLFWGLGGVLSNEITDLQHRLIDLPENPRETEFAALLKEIQSNEWVNAVAIRDEKRYLNYLAPLPIEELTHDEVEGVTDGPFQLKLRQTGDLGSFYFEKSERRQPEANEIEMKVHSVSINFKDLLKVLGQLDRRAVDATYFGSAIGMECSGIITAIGENIKDLKVGQPLVMPVSQGAFRSYVTQEPEYYIPMPPGISFEEAPVTTPCMTVLYGFEDIAHLKRGEKVLIHSATGSVGIAAIQLAQWLGAEIYATAGNEEKRAYLKSLGVKYIYDSRSLNFVEGILKDTDGYGIDVVLNSVAGEVLQQSLLLLAPHGRFLEIGKRDIIENNSIPLSIFNRGITFSTIDMDRMLRNRPAIIKDIFRRIYAGFVEGKFKAMPVKSYPAEEVETAFRQMSRSLHLGKLVVDFEKAHVRIKESKSLKAFTELSTIVITGGTSGLGLGLADKFSQHGVSDIVLVSRSGGDPDILMPQIEEMAKRGTNVHVQQVDISSNEATQLMFEELSKTLPPIRGIIHGAMILDDSLLKDVTVKQLQRVLSPKISGVWNLHRASLGLNLEFFVCLSSISSLIGNPGQAAYAAANAGLDAFAYYRQSLGLPAMTINLGVVAEVGVVARGREEVARQLDSSGIKPMAVDEIFEMLHKLLYQPQKQVGMFKVNWTALASRLPKLAEDSRFIEILRERDQPGDGTTPTSEIAKELLTLNSFDRITRMEGVLIKEIADVLRIPPEKIETDRKLNHLGVDSLMAVELEHQMARSTGVVLASVDFLGGASISQLAEKFLDLLNLEVPEKPIETSISVDEMAEDEVDKLLRELSTSAEDKTIA